MIKTLRYLLYASRPNYIAALIIGAAIAAGCMLTGGAFGSTSGLAHLFVSYYNMIPTILLLTILLTGVALTTSTLNQVLAFGGRRTDYYQGQIAFTAINALIYWGIAQIFSYLPVLMNWREVRQFYSLDFGVYFLIMAAASSSLGSAIGPFFVRSRGAAALLSGLCSGILVYLSLTYTFEVFLGWNSTNWFFLFGYLLVALLCQLRTHSIILNATVR